MWWPRRAGTALAALLLVAGLGACGFRPLYGEHAANPVVSDELASVRVEPLRDRQGQLIHNALLTNLTPRGESEHPRYLLVVRPSITESQQSLRKDDTATRNVLFYHVGYYLYEGQTVLTAGTIDKVYSYDFLQEHYANISTQEDVQRRAATAVAEEVRNRVAAYFTKAAEVRAQAATH